MITLGQLKISLQRALLGNVPASMKAVTAGIVDAGTIHIRVYFDGRSRESERELTGIIGAEVVADFPDIVDIREETVITDAPANRLDCLEFWAYVRYEE